MWTMHVTCTQLICEQCMSRVHNYYVNNACHVYTINMWTMHFENLNGIRTSTHAHARVHNYYVNNAFYVYTITMWTMHVTCTREQCMARVHAHVTHARTRTHARTHMSRVHAHVTCKQLICEQCMSHTINMWTHVTHNYTMHTHN